MDRSDFTDPSGVLVDVAPRNGRAYLAYVPNPLPPAVEADAVASVVALLAEANQALGELIGIGRLLPSPDLLLRPYIRQEAVASSAIEGTVATFSDLVAFEANRVAPPNSDVVDVLNYTTALDQGLAAVRTHVIDADLLRRLHRTLMSHARGEDFSTPGEFRTIQNHIGGGRQPADGHFVPPPPFTFQDCLASLIDYLNAPDAHNTPVLVRAAWAHYQFEAIHPFLDGNGRVGRLLIPLLIARRLELTHPLLYLSPYFRRHRTRYYDLLYGVSATSDWGGWLQFFLEAVVQRARAAIHLSDQILELGVAWQERLRERRASASAHRLAQHVHEAIVVDAGDARRALDVQAPAAYRAIAVLEAAGILTEITGRPRDRLWAARELLTLFTI